MKTLICVQTNIRQILQKQSAFQVGMLGAFYQRRAPISVEISIIGFMVLLQEVEMSMEQYRMRFWQEGCRPEQSHGEIQD